MPIRTLSKSESTVVMEEKLIRNLSWLGRGLVVVEV